MMNENKVEVEVTKLVGSGQGLATLADGKKVFVWNALPGEKVLIRLINQKRTYAEAITEEIIEPSADRIAPQDESYLATSPWQIMTFASENRYKRNITEELFRGLNIKLPSIVGTTHDKREWYYRNKMEYSFWGDDSGLHLAHYYRGTHGKQIVTGSSLAMPAVDVGARSVLALLRKLNVRAGALKTIIVRASQAGEVAASLYVKTETFPDLAMPEELRGLRVFYSNPKSPASVPTRLQYEIGDSHLHDELLGKDYIYDTQSFFQVNVPVFEEALKSIRQHNHADDFIDMYAGVGSIGLSVAGRSVELIEVDAYTANMARLNARQSGLEARVIETSTEKALACISESKPLILDPPRSGLHEKVTDKILEVLPPQVSYLSCNPVTQARDTLKLQERYDIVYFEIFNFFPRTPHVETLAILKKR